MSISTQRKTAFVFSGQGSQQVGMGQQFYARDAQYRAILDEAENVAMQPLISWMFNEASRLEKTEHVQPMIFAMQAGIIECLRAAGVQADGACGLSLGEFAALYAQGVFSFEEGMRTLIHRGYFMAEAAAQTPTGMVALLGQADRVETLLEAFPHCSVANYNLPTQTVVGGPIKDLQKLVEAAPSQGFKRAVLLPTAGAFHTRYMAEAAKQFEHYLKPSQWSMPRPELYLNTTGTVYHGEESLQALMVKQMVAPTHFHTMITNMVQAGYTRFIEIGPGKVLVGMIKKLDRSLLVDSIENPEELERAVERLRSEA